MCGIAGVIGIDNTTEAVTAVRKMTDSIARRGPDGEGIEVWSDAVLGHRRLAIIDLSDAGRQPMLSPDGTYGVVFNGEVYNFLDLRVELIGLGYNFASDTDTEVLIHGYKEWGIDRLVSRMRGMFAFALWDDYLAKALSCSRPFRRKAASLRRARRPSSICFDGASFAASRALPKR